MFRFSLRRVGKSSAAFSSSSVKSSQFAFRKLSREIEAELVKEISEVIVMREGLSCDLINLSNVQRSGVVPQI